MDGNVFVAQVGAWVVFSGITVVVCALGGWFPITALAVLGIAIIWAVIIFGGFLIMDDLDSFF